MTNDPSPCQSCGACCDTSADWPRFTLESDMDLERIPERYIASDASGMKCLGDRCSALAGTVGSMTACVIYDRRPLVCRDCLPGDDACTIARRKHGMTPLLSLA